VPAGKRAALPSVLAACISNLWLGATSIASVHASSCLHGTISTPQQCQVLEKAGLATALLVSGTLDEQPCAVVSAGAAPLTSHHTALTGRAAVAATNVAAANSQPLGKRLKQPGRSAGDRLASAIAHCHVLVATPGELLVGCDMSAMSST
jgi:hypothetical protein